jgi:hypothetical protein
MNNLCANFEDFIIYYILRFFNLCIWGLMWNRAYARIAAFEKQLGKPVRLDVTVPGYYQEGGQEICWSARLFVDDGVVAYSYFPGFTATSSDTDPGFTLPRRTMETYDLLFDGWFRDMQTALATGKYKFVENIVVADCVFRAIDALEFGIAQHEQPKCWHPEVFGSVADSVFGKE